MVAYWTDYGFSKVTGAPSYAWRVPVALQLVFVILIGLLVLVIPETPRWLAAHGRSEEALVVLSRLADKDTSHPSVQATYEEIMATVQAEKEVGHGSWSDIVKDDAIKSRRRFMIACAIQIFQQAGGINGNIFRLVHDY